MNHALIQAPMAGGITTNDLVVEVSNNGALGMIGAGYMNVEDLQTQIKEIKKRCQSPFGVNVFVPGKLEIDMNKVEQAKKLLRPYYNPYNLDIHDNTLTTEQAIKQTYEEQLACIMKEKVPVCSFTFGAPDKKTIKQLHEHGIIVVGTATTVEEAKVIEEI